MLCTLQPFEAGRGHAGRGWGADGLGVPTMRSCRGGGHGGVAEGVVHDGISAAA